MFKKVSLGYSDIASLTVRSCEKVWDMHFGEDGHLWAYEGFGDGYIDEDFEPVFEGENWLWIYDDNGKVYDERGHEKVTILRAVRGDSVIYLIHWH